ncbi:hypothetical protein BU23DRAFT_563196 [Bimuria novae-zelandiae CBS 107.79]|uniref:Mid2 domain-containing protein n=1 Tax=Bimuria novae-zelandiae CBS 107.79 TaxID=1447943 RepID=A0A6A5VT95_9PLEO|nr:hypothetical protein BU23DRAFT_563196 [Bimuria novae-zelandiae CBS 107.79]
MAPTAQASGSSPSATPESQNSSALPGLKRGIAVGVASSVCFILIALLALFLLRHRKQRKAQQQQAAELPNWSDEKKAPPPPVKDWVAIPSSPIEADTTRTIYELDAGEVPELPTKIHILGAQELDADSTIDDLNGLKRKSLAIVDTVESYGGSEPRSREVPTLQISPPELSPLSTSPLLGVSPVSVSPLEEAYLPQSPRSPRSPQHLM